MPLADALLMELDRELAVTRKLLERVPDRQFAWKPHPKSFTLGQLASHVAELPQWGVMTITQSELNLDGSGGPTAPASHAALLAAFDEHAAAFRKNLTGRTDAELLAPWTLKHMGKPLFSMPRVSVLRSFVMNHLIHHRGQLSVYLRQLDVPLPSIYGPSADEASF
jgi:uncharacterized damage-inducible protein DinB